MVNPYAQRVQQKLAHVRLMLELWAACGDSLPDRQKQEALLDSAVMHLGVAMTVYFKEIAQNHGVAATPRVHSLDQLEYELSAKGVKDAALVELSASAQHGWLGDLQALVKQTQYPVVSAPLGMTMQGGAIAVAGGGINHSAPVRVDEGLVRRLLGEFEQMVDRQRHANLEY